MLHKLDDYSLNYENIVVVDNELVMFGDKYTQKVSECRRKLLILFSKVPHLPKDALEMTLVILLKFRAAHHENRLQLEG